MDGIVTKQNTMKVVRTRWILRLRSGVTWASFKAAVVNSRVSERAVVTNVDLDGDDAVIEFEEEAALPETSV